MIWITSAFLRSHYFLRLLLLVTGGCPFSSISWGYGVHKTAGYCPVILVVSHVCPFIAAVSQEDVSRALLPRQLRRGELALTDQDLVAWAGVAGKVYATALQALERGDDAKLAAVWTQGSPCACSLDSVMSVDVPESEVAYSVAA